MAALMEHNFRLLLRTVRCSKCNWCDLRHASGKTLEHARHFPVKSKPMLPPGTFEGKTAFISGGGTGLGKGMALFMSRLGANVAISSRKMEALEKTADEISKETGNKVLPVAADVRDEEAVKQAFDTITSNLGLPTIIVNNAAGNFVSPTERLSYNAWKTIIDIVLNGTANVTCIAAHRLMKAGQGGAFLSISTDYATTGSGFVAPSASAKAGVETLTKSLAAEWGRYGFRFNCISPGPIETKGAFSRLDPSGMFMDEAVKTIPLGRMGEIAELANLACYLVSDYSSWISGQIIRLNGGQYPAQAGLFTPLLKVTNEQWDQLEAMIRGVKGS